MMLRFLVFLGLSFSTSLALAQHELQIFVPGVQFRYEEGSDQQLDLRSYTHYAANYMYESVLLGVEYNTNEDNTGMTSLGVRSKNKEWNGLLGYSLAKLEFQNVARNTNIEILGFVLAGKTEADITTSLNGQAKTNTSEAQSVFGVGGLIFFRLDYFIAGLDTRMMQSSAFLPKSVFVNTIKLGVNFKF
ncbi:hypothetical protein CIK05_13735 [Bdellovibrio sp. qaytius]|nr:hypothetical protein CIK05_13735 [Bdellovibrio sp. qaytius]